MKKLDKFVHKQKWLLLLAVLIATAATATTALYAPPTNADANALRKQKAKIELKKTQEQNNVSLRATAITAAGDYGAGDYSLTDVTLTSALSFSGNATLKLSGTNTINISAAQNESGTGGVVGIYVAANAILTIEDASSGGTLTITVANSGTTKASAIYNEENGTTILKSGTLTVTGTHSNSAQGFGVYNKGEFKVEGGSLLFGESTTADFDNSETGVTTPANVKFIATGGKVAGTTNAKPVFAGSISTIIDIAENADVDISIPLLESYSGLVAPYYTITTNLDSWTALAGSTVALTGTGLTATVTTPENTPWGAVTFDNITHFILVDGTVSHVVPTYNSPTGISFTAPAAADVYTVYTRFQITQDAQGNKYYLTKKLGTLTVTEPAANSTINIEHNTVLTGTLAHNYVVTGDNVTVTLRDATITGDFKIDAGKTTNLVLDGTNSIAPADPNKSQQPAGDPGVTGLWVAAGANLTISGTGTLDVTATNSGTTKASAIYNDQGASITLQQGTVTATGTQTNADVSRQGFGVYNKGAFTVSGGTLLLPPSKTAEFDNSIMDGVTGIKFIVSSGKVAGTNGDKPRIDGSTATIIDIAENADVDVSIPLLEEEPFKSLVAPYYTISTDLTTWTAEAGSTVTLAGTGLTATVTTPNQAPFNGVTFDNITHFILVNTSTGAVTPKAAAYEANDATTISFTAPATGTYKVYTRFQLLAGTSNEKYYLTKNIGTLTVTEATAEDEIEVTADIADDSESLIASVSPLQEGTVTDGKDTFIVTLEENVVPGGKYTVVDDQVEPNDLSAIVTIAYGIADTDKGIDTIKLNGVIQDTTIVVSYTKPATVGIFAGEGITTIARTDTTAKSTGGTYYTFKANPIHEATSDGGQDSLFYVYYRTVAETAAETDSTTTATPTGVTLDKVADDNDSIFVLFVPQSVTDAFNVYVNYTEEKVVKPTVTVEAGEGLTTTLGDEITPTYSREGTDSVYTFKANPATPAYPNSGYVYSYTLGGAAATSVAPTGVTLTGPTAGGAEDKDSVFVLKVSDEVTLDLVLTVSYEDTTTTVARPWNVTVIGDESVVIGKNDVTYSTLTAQVDNDGEFVFSVDTAVAYENIPGKFVFTGENSRETLDLTPDPATDSVTIETVTTDTTILVTYTPYPKVTVNAENNVKVTDQAGTQVIPTGSSIYTNSLTGGQVTFNAYVEKAAGWVLYANGTPQTGENHLTTDRPDSLVYNFTINISNSKDSTVNLVYTDARSYTYIYVSRGEGVSLVGGYTSINAENGVDTTFKVKIATPVTGSVFKVDVEQGDVTVVNEYQNTYDDSDSTYTVKLKATAQSNANAYVYITYTLPNFVSISANSTLIKVTKDQAATQAPDTSQWGGVGVYADAPNGTATFYVTVPTRSGWDIKVQPYPIEAQVSVGTGTQHTPEPDSTTYKVTVAGSNAYYASVIYSQKAEVSILPKDLSIATGGINPSSGPATNGKYEFTVEIADRLATGGSISVVSDGRELVGSNINGGYTLYAIAGVDDTDPRKYNVTIHGITSGGTFTASVGYVAQPTVIVNETTNVSVYYGQTYGVATTSGTYTFNVDLSDYVRNGKLTVAPTPSEGVTTTITGESNPYTITLSGLTTATNVRVEYATQPFNWTVVPVADGDTAFVLNNNGVIASSSNSYGTFGFNKPTLSNSVQAGGKYFYSVIGITGNEQTTLKAEVDTTNRPYVELPYTTDNKPVDSVSVIVGYLPPANLPTYTPPVKEPVVVIKPADKPVENATTGEVAITAKPEAVDVNVPETYQAKGSIIPGGIIDDAIVTVAAEAAVIATPQTVVITFTGALAAILPSLEVANVEVNHSTIKIVYIFDNSTKSALTTRALETRAARLRAGENTSSYAVYDPESNTIYIHLVDIDVDAIGEEETHTTLAIKDGEFIGEVDKDITLYDHPIVLVPDNGVPSIGYAGYFTLSGSYPTDGQLQYRLENDPINSYKSYYPSTGLLLSEIARLANGEKLYFAIWGAPKEVGDLYVYIPKTYDNIAGGGSDGGSYIPSLARNVFISATASSEGLLKISTASGITTDGTFQFTITPTEVLPGYELVLHFYKDWLLVGSNYEPIATGLDQPNADGTYTVTLTNIKVSDLQIVVEYRQGAVGNDNVDADKVWSNDKTLFVISTGKGIANVYSINGGLVKTVKVDANTLTSTELPQGTYIVTLNGKSTKVNTK